MKCQITYLPENWAKIIQKTIFMFFIEIDAQGVFVFKNGRCFRFNQANI